MIKLIHDDKEYSLELQGDYLAPTGGFPVLNAGDKVSMEGVIHTHRKIPYGDTDFIFNHVSSNSYICVAAKTCCN